MLGWLSPLLPPDWRLGWEGRAGRDARHDRSGGPAMSGRSRLLRHLFGASAGGPRAGRTIQHPGVWRSMRAAGYAPVRIALGVVLLLAAVLKAHQLVFDPPLGGGLFENRWFLAAIAELELFFGLWLLAGLYPHATRLVAMLCFAGFAGVSLAKILGGERGPSPLESECSECVVGVLDPARTWLVPTPVVVALDEGYVVRCAIGVPDGPLIAGVARAGSDR